MTHLQSELIPAPWYCNSNVVVSMRSVVCELEIEIEIVLFSVWSKALVESKDRRRKNVPTSKVCRHFPLLASHILIVLSPDVEASQVESCEKATELRPLLWPSSVCGSGFLSAV